MLVAEALQRGHGHVVFAPMDSDGAGDAMNHYTDSTVWRANKVGGIQQRRGLAFIAQAVGVVASGAGGLVSVSYTQLTLPPICSV